MHLHDQPNLIEMFLNLNTLRCFLPLVVSIFFINTSNLQAQVDFKENLVAVEYDVGFLLTWTTSSEINNQFFTIERSQDGGKFETIGSVNSKFKSSNTAYKYTDLELGLKKVTYRLKQVSKNGDYSYSNEVKKEKEFVCYFKVVKKENITNETLQITINSIKDGEIEYRLINEMGEILLEELKPLETGLNDYVLDFQSEADGDYYLVFKLEAELESVYFKKETKDKKGNVAKKKTEIGKGG